ncbi:zinc finger FYVE domain-containing protein 1 isoform X2 [Dendroctonus ponderosae]|nr:zinc finger FYVE domain-containing protein 1 isoform X2 [Dendroctonus ponderosae]
MIQFEVREPPGSQRLSFLGKLSSNMNSLASESKKRHSFERGSPLILPSLQEDPRIMGKDFDNTKILDIYPSITGDLQSLIIGADEPEHNGQRGILLIDDNETLRIESDTAFSKALNIEPDKKIKVVSIFGNTGVGKSYTLNKLFFNGEEVFKTSPSQVSCTLGVWAKYDPTLNVLCLDTEGLLGIAKRENQRTRLLLKILAVSDIIIYRTRSERLQRDMYSFLGGASNVYKQHFYTALQKTLARSDGEKINAGLAPGVIIFHETQYTDTLHVLNNHPNVTAEDILRQNFADLGSNCEEFSFIKYIGVKTRDNQETSFDRLRAEIQKELESSNVRSARKAKYVYLMLKSLNDKFFSPLTESNHEQFLAQFFTCPEKCQSCSASCVLSTGHKEDDEPHKCNAPCKFQHQYQNFVYLCKKCVRNGERSTVEPKYTKDNSWTSYLNLMWSGYVIHCPKCGVIYKSREHWYGNKNPEDCAVQLEVVHMWPGDQPLFGTFHSGQRVVDGVSVITDAVASVSSPPTKMLLDYMNDKIAPSYWKSNHEIKACFKCNVSFVSGQNRVVPSKHHCRGCGEGFCGSCSSKKCPVPHRGWKEPERVCDACFDELEGRGQSLIANISEEQLSGEVTPRYIGERLVNAISAIKYVYDVPKNCIKEYVRPSYWTPDSECINCVLCNNPFGTQLPLHHCRDCGKGVCDNCSTSRKPVPVKGWDSPVRVCDTCR